MGSTLCKQIFADKIFFEHTLFFPGVPMNKKRRQEIFADYEIEIPNYIATSKHEKCELDQINLIKNDVLIMINKSTNNDLCIVKNLRTKLIGKVPIKAVRPFSDTRSEEWFYSNINRYDAERFLKDYPNIRGTFLIRDSASLENSYALSVLNINSDTGDRKVYHYLIKNSNSTGYYIDNKNSPNSSQIKFFGSIEELLNHYKENKELCCKLANCYKKNAEFEIEWEMDRKNVEYRERDILGGGEFGKVYKGILRLQKNYDVAVKRIKNITDSLQKSALIDECNLMKRLKHEKIIKLFCICSKEEPILLVLEFLENGSLKDFLKKVNSKLDLRNIIDINIQITSGMKYIEEVGIVHRDLSARNILVGRDNLIKIADFGLAEKLNIYGKAENIKRHLPIKWMAPEVLKDYFPVYTIKSDIWSFGILLYEIITFGGDPYPDFTGPGSNETIKYKIQNEDYRMPKPTTGLCTDAYYSIMKECWKKVPEERPTFEALNNWFYDYFINIEPQYQQN